MKKLLVALFLVLGLSACAPQFRLPGPVVAEPTLNHKDWVAADGTSLPLRSWLPPGPPKAVLLALHGMNDYSNFFDDAGRYLASKGIAAYAYDQRGFGSGKDAGFWSSSEAMAGDLRQAAALVGQRHPGVPLYLLGESMGGAVTIEAAAGNPPPGIKGVILSAPAVWGRDTMGFFPRVMLWLAYNTVPGMTLTGEGLHIQASDNIEMLRRLSKDPLVIKATRVDAIEGLVDLMDKASRDASALRLPALVLYGEKDEVIPRKPVKEMVERLPRLGDGQRFALYPQGWHMLLRDLEAKVVLDDIAAWIADPKAPLPSGADRQALERLTD